MNGPHTLDLYRLSDLIVRLPLYARWNVTGGNGYSTLDFNLQELPNDFLEVRFLN